MVRYIDNGAATKAVAITPNDSTDLATVTRGIYVGAGGNLRVLLADDTSPVTLTNVSAGVIYPLRVKRVYSTTTTASGLIGLS
jgi:hypothetical protein